MGLSPIPSTNPRIKFETLRNIYPVFKYERFSICSHGTGVHVQFRFCVPPDLCFTPEISFESVPSSWKQIPHEVLDNLVFHLGLIEMFSYWKATCSPDIVIEEGFLKTPQLIWWKDLLLHGMREFFYVNQIDFKSKDFVRIRASQQKKSKANCYSHSLSDGNLVLISGGRDSALTAKLLQNDGKPFTCMFLNPTLAARRVARKVGCVKSLVVRRSIDPLLLDLNRRGFLNGHTPFSAYLAFLNAVCLVLYDHSNIVVANERSSNEGNILYRGTKLNHQYSKSFRFEAKFDDYLQRYLLAGGRYFSLLRPLYELQIGRKFATFPELFGIFRSCNKNQMQDSWCGTCPKCLSVFVTMYPFVSNDELIHIFGKDFFQDQGSIPSIRRLAGLDGHKPFECVCTIKEAIASLYLCVEKACQSGHSLPVALQHVQETILSQNGKARSLATKLLTSSSHQHRLPSEFEQILSR